MSGFQDMMRDEEREIIQELQSITDDLGDYLVSDDAQTERLRALLAKMRVQFVERYQENP